MGPISQNLSSVTNDIFCCYKLVKSLLLIGYQQICHIFLSFVIEKGLCETGSWASDHIVRETVWKRLDKICGGVVIWRCD